MSRNRKIRDIASIMQPTLRDDVFPVDHFKVMKKIEKEDGVEAVQAYIKTILGQQEALLRAEEELKAKIKRKEARFKTLVQWFNIIIGTMGLLAFLTLLQWIIQHSK